MDIRLPDPEGNMLTVDTGAIPRHVLELKGIEWECTADEALRRLMGEIPEPVADVVQAWLDEEPVMHLREITDQGTLFCPICRLDTDACYTPSLQWLTTETHQRSHPYLVVDGRMVRNMHPLDAGHPVWPTEPEVLHEFLWCHHCNTEFAPGQFGVIL